MTAVTNTDSSWKLAVGELTYYTISVLPIVYIIHTQGRPALRPWIYLSIYVGLQMAGNGMIAGAGRPHTECTGTSRVGYCTVEGGDYSYVAPILTSVGLSPLLIGTAGILHQWWGTTRFARSSGPDAAKKALIVTLVFHVLAVTAIALIATGGSLQSQTPPASNALTLLRVGAILLFVLFLVLCAATVYLALKYRSNSSRALLWSVILSLHFLGIRYAYELASTISWSIDLNPIFGRLVYRIALEVIPQALVLLILIIGSITHTEEDIQKDITVDRTATIPLREQDEHEERASGQKWMRGSKTRLDCGMFNF